MYVLYFNSLSFHMPVKILSVFFTIFENIRVDRYLTVKNFHALFLYNRKPERTLNLAEFSSNIFYIFKLNVAQVKSLSTLANAKK